MYTDLLVDLDKKFELELAHLGDLSKFTFTQLREKIPQFKIVIDNFGTHFIANFESAYTVIQIQYDPSGVFEKIVDQYWK
jgi:hypothetical protein